jgi:hypothetical protein
MKFRTEIIIPPAPFQISHLNKIMMIGSCFVENMSDKIRSAGFTIYVNPFGIVYNPVSIANGLCDLIRCKNYNENDLFFHKEIYYSFSHHSRFSGMDKKMVLENINKNIRTSSNFLQQSDMLIITFGTANVYELLSSKQVVSNCHKLPAKLFCEKLLTVSSITEQWNRLIQVIREFNPNLKILFTVSPIRHWKDGANENQLNKATLLLAVNELINANKDCFYFPSYEIMIDDLRDYRFYAEDMIHPNAQAIHYIWEKFGDAYFSENTKKLIKEWESIQQLFNHMPFNSNSEEYQSFLEKGKKKKEEFLKNNPFFYF